MPFDNIARCLNSMPAPLPKTLEYAIIEKRVPKDIEQVVNYGLSILKEIGIFLEVPVNKCIDCKQFLEECPENALEIVEINDKRIAKYDSQKCLGTNCRRCVGICPESTIDLTKLKSKQNKLLWDLTPILFLNVSSLTFLP